MPCFHSTSCLNSPSPNVHAMVDIYLCNSTEQGKARSTYVGIRHNYIDICTYTYSRALKNYAIWWHIVVTILLQCCDKLRTIEKCQSQYKYVGTKLPMYVDIIELMSISWGKNNLTKLVVYIHWPGGVAQWPSRLHPERKILVRIPLFYYKVVGLHALQGYCLELNMHCM
jgi:hypothetical protein